MSSEGPLFLSFNCYLLLHFYFSNFTNFTYLNVVCSEEEAKKKIYSVSTSTYTGFGALISEELSYKVKGAIDSLLFYVSIFILVEVFLLLELLGFPVSDVLLSSNWLEI